jgi:hypothetical protein
MTKQPKYPIEQTDSDQARASATKRDEPPPYGVPAFRHRHEQREPAERSDVAYLRSHPEFSRRPHRRGAGRRVL